MSTPPAPTERENLEIQKLRLEITHLQRWWHQPIFIQVGISLLAATVGGVLAISSSYYSSKFQLSTQLSLQRVQEQRAVFARLMGRKFTTKQLYVSRYEAMIFSDYHEERWKLAGSPKDSLDLQEAQRWMHRSEDLVFEIVKNNQSLFEDVGTVRALFADTPKLRELADHVYNFKSLWTAKPPDDSKKLDAWKTEAGRQLQTLVDTEYGKPIEDLVAYLIQQLPPA